MTTLPTPIDAGTAYATVRISQSVDRKPSLVLQPTDALLSTDVAEMQLREGVHLPPFFAMFSYGVTPLLEFDVINKYISMIFEGETTRRWDFPRQQGQDVVTFYGSLLVRTAGGVDRPYSGARIRFLMRTSYTRG